MDIEHVTDEELEELRLKCESRACEARASQIGGRSPLKNRRPRLEEWDS